MIAQQPTDSRDEIQEERAVLTRRWFQDDRTREVANRLAEHYATSFRNPVVKLALRRLRNIDVGHLRQEVMDLLHWIKATARPKTNLLMTSWRPSTEDVDLIYAWSEEFDLTHHDVIRLAIYLLAMEEGIPAERYAPPPVAPVPAPEPD